MLKRILRMIGLLKPYKFRVLILVAVGLVYALTNVAFVQVLDYILKSVLVSAKGATGSDIFPEWINSALGTSDFNRRECFYVCCGFLAVCMALTSVGVYYRRFMGEWLGYRVVVDTQSKLAKHMLGLEYSFFKNQRMGELLSRLTNDLFLLTRTVLILCIFITRPIQLASLLLFLFWTNWQMTLYGLVGAPIAVVLFSYISKTMRRASRSAQTEMANVTDSLVRFLSGIMVVKAFSCEDYEYQIFRKRNEDYFSEVVAREKAVSLERPITSSSTKLGMFVAILIGGNMILSGTMEANELVAFIAALGFMADPMKELSRGNSELQVALPGGERVFELMDNKQSQRIGGRVMQKFTGPIVFDNVCFRYDEANPVLKGISLEINKGETVALVGASGSGKTTLTNLVLRFYEVGSGCISIDGRDIRDYSLSSLRSKIALVGQAPFLFNTTIAENIAYGVDDYSMDDVYAAAKAANIHDEIMELSNGYSTVVGERGDNLSGGQRQRVTIARAIYRNPPIMLLDEATSALDSESEKKVQEALDNLMQERTSIVIAHRLSTIRNADRIVVLDDGKIVGMGKHDELLKSCQVYVTLSKLQETSPETAHA